MKWPIKTRDEWLDFARGVAISAHKLGIEMSISNPKAWNLTRNSYDAIVPRDISDVLTDAQIRSVIKDAKEYAQRHGVEFSSSVFHWRTISK